MQFFRTVCGRDQVAIAAALLDIMLDAGIVPAIFIVTMNLFPLPSMS